MCFHVNLYKLYSSFLSLSFLLCHAVAKFRLVMKYKLINGCAETVLQETSLGKLTETLESFSHKTHAAKSRLLKQTYLVSKQQLYTEHAVH